MEEDLRQLVEFKLRGLFDSKQCVADYYQTTWEDLQRIHGQNATITKVIREKENIDQDTFDQYSDISSHIQRIKDKFNQRRRQDFDGTAVDFYDWYENQDKKCCYCEISEEDLKALFDAEIITSEKFTGTLHIERFDPKQGYKRNNMGLACSLCNNAKSDMISKEYFKKYFAPAMKSFYGAKIKELKK